jgi:hypothetical protein
MVFYRPQQQQVQQQRVRPGARRVGQAEMGVNAMIPQGSQALPMTTNSQQPLNPAQQREQDLALQIQDFATQAGFEQGGAPQDLGILLAAANTPYLQNETQSLDQIQNNTGLKIDIASGTNGSETVVVTAANGTQSFLTLPTQQAPAPIPQAQCEFPAQDLRLERQVTITNTAPQLASVDTDVCGNVVGYRETIDRRIQAGPWMPLSGLQGNVDNIQDVNGMLESSNFGANVTYANSRGLQQGPPVPNVVSQQLVGNRRQTNNGNRNIGYGLGAMRGFRSA